MVESVQLLKADEADKAKVSMKRLLYLTALTAPLSSRKRNASNPLTHDESPAKAAKCRALGKHYVNIIARVQLKIYTRFVIAELHSLRGCLAELHSMQRKKC